MLRNIRWLSTLADGKWIYANKFEDISARARIGKLRMCPSVTDLNDVTIRMYDALTSCHIIVCDNQQHTSNLLYSLVNKIGRVEPAPRYTEIMKTEKASTQYSEYAIELSEHIKYKKEYARLAGQPLDMKSVVKEQKYIKIYNLKKSFRYQIEGQRKRKGHGFIIGLAYYEGIKEYIDEGFDVTYLYEEGSENIGRFMSFVEYERFAYEILPGPCGLISTLAASGFPADRFGIEYYPTNNPKKLVDLLKVRKNQNFTVAMMDLRGQIERLLRAIITVYGYKQLVFLSANEILRHTAGYCLKIFEYRPLPNQTYALQKCYVIVAPHAIDYNDDVKDKEFEKAFINDKLQEQSGTTLQLKYLSKKLQSLQYEKYHKINGLEAARYLLTLLPTEYATQQLLQKLLRIGYRDSKILIEEAKNRGMDALAIEYNQLKLK